MYWLYDLAAWQLGFLIVSTFLGFATAGLVLSRSWLYDKLRLSNDTNDSVNGFFAGVGVLYGLLLGLVAVAAWENYEKVDELAGKEAVEVASLYRDVSTLEEPTKTELQQILRRYLRYVIDVAWPAHKKGETPNGGTRILSEFLGTLSNYHTKSAEQEVFLGEIFGAYNRLVEARRLRLEAVNLGVPEAFWVVILAGAALAIGLTYFFHLPSLRTHLILTGIFSIFVGLMIFLIFAVDKPFRGEVRVKPSAYISVLNGLKDLESI